jgi:hypothetical protein
MYNHNYTTNKSAFCSRLALAAGELNEAGYALWLKPNSRQG